jgi:hypothetical protein
MSRNFSSLEIKELVLAILLIRPPETCKEFITQVMPQLYYYKFFGDIRAYLQVPIT